MGTNRAGKILVIWILGMLLSSPACYGGEKIRVVAAGFVYTISNLKRFFDPEPAIDYHAVPARDPGGQFGFREADLVKMIRQYFPRTYEELKAFDLLILTSPEFYLFTKKQDQWMYAAIEEGMGGINDASVFSIISGIAESWSASQTQLAFPNDAPAVTARKAGEAPSDIFKVEINRDAEVPILSVFAPYGVDEMVNYGASRMIINREGSEVLAWQLMNFGSAKIPYIAIWEYGAGRTLTMGQGVGVGWLGYPTNPQHNQYAPDMLMNMIFWLTHHRLIEDVEVYHRLKTHFAEYNSRLLVLISLMNFIDRFGANTQKIQDQINQQEELYDRASQLYMEQEYVACEDTIMEALKRFAQVEEIAKKEKEQALTWVYVIEWLVSASTFFVSGFVLWTLMVRRRLYKTVQATRLKELEKELA